MQNDLQQLAAFYDVAAADYDSQVGGEVVNKKLRAAFCRFVSARAGPGGAILDFGCGTGLDAMWYAAHRHRVMAYDISAGMVDVLRRRCPAEVNSRAVVPLAGPFDVLEQGLCDFGTVSAVAANFAVLNHLADLRPLFRFFASQLRSEGTVTAMFLNPWYSEDVKRPWWWKGVPRSLWTGNLCVPGTVTTYRFYERSLCRMAAPYFRLQRRWDSAAVLSERPASGGWRDLFASNFMILSFSRSR